MTRLESMTSDTTKPETTPQAHPDTFRSHLPAIVAATTGTVLAAILGSLIGAAGTIVGIVIGSLASGTASWWAERGIRRSAALATARAEALRARAERPFASALGRSSRVHRRRVYRLRHRGHLAGGCGGQAAVGRGPGQAGPRHNPRRRIRG